MLTREEFALMEHKLVAQRETKEELENQIKEEQEKNKQLADLRLQVDQLARQNEEEEQRQMKELAEATNELHNFHGQEAPKRSIFAGIGEQNKLPKLESQLASLKEKHEKISKMLEEFEQANAANETQAKPVLEQIEKIEARLQKLEKYKVRIPPASPIILQMEDLENTKTELEREIRESEEAVPRITESVDLIQSENTLKLAELRRMNAEGEAATLEADQTRAKTDAIFLDLEKLSGELQTMNVERRAEVDKSAAERKKNEELSAKAKAEVAELTKQIEECKEELEKFPVYIKNAHKDSATLLHKRKAMVEQLEKKLDECHQELIEKQSESPIVKQLTEELEKRWVEHQKLFDKFTKAQAMVDRKKLDIRRKEMAIAEISKKWPATGKVKIKKGIKELEYIYEEALIQNRKMAGDLGILNDDIAVQEEMNRTLKAALEEAERASKTEQ